MSGLAALLGALGEDIERKQKLSASEMLTVLKAAAPRFQGGCPFTIGDIVTPRKGTSYKDQGDPAIVIAVRPQADFDFIGEPSSQSFGERHDIRVLWAVSADTVVPFWVEAAQFEPYVAPVEAANQQAA